MKKFLSILLVSVLLIAVLSVTAACTPAEEWPVEEGAEVITVYLREFEDWSNNYTISAIRRFNENLNDGIQVEYTLLLDTVYEDKVSGDREAGKAPDIYLVSYGNLLTQVDNNNLLPLDDVISQKMYDDISDNAFNYVYMRNHLYAVPFCFEPSMMLFYSKSALNKAGVTSIPTNYEEMLAACAKIKPTLSKTQYVIGVPHGLPNGWANIGQFYNACGGHLPISDNWDRSLVNDNKEGYKAFLEYYSQFYTKGYTSAGNTAGGYNEIIREVCEGRMAMTFAGSYAISTIYDEYPETVDDIGVAQIPTRDGTQDIASTTNGGWSYVLDAAAGSRRGADGRTHAELAAIFLEYLLTDPIVATEYFEKANYCKFAGYDSIIEAIAPKAADNKYYAVVTAAASNAITPPLYNYDITTGSANMIEEMVYNAKSADAAITAYNTKVENIIKNNKLAGKNPQYQGD